MEGKSAVEDNLTRFYFETFGDLEAGKSLPSLQSRTSSAWVLYKRCLNTHPCVLIFLIPKLWVGLRPSEADCFLFCRKHSSLMTGEVTRRSIQTLKQGNQPKFQPLIKAARPKKKSCDLRHNICDRKARRDTRRTRDAMMPDPGRASCGQGRTAAIKADLRRLNEEGVLRQRVLLWVRSSWGAQRVFFFGF